MSPEVAIAKLKALSPEHQQAVLDFIEFLASKEQQTAPVSEDWKADPFFGIWCDRQDITDSAAYSRELRRTAWNRKNVPNSS